jgi:hypothetical protein
MTGPYFTPKLGLLVPDVDSEIDSARSNWDRLDETQGVIWVAPDVVPSNDQLYEGAIIAETTTGKVWRAEKDLNGNLIRKWIKYPWMIAASAAGAITSTAVAENELGYTTVSTLDSVNANRNDLVDGRAIAPVKGIYAGVDIMRWEATGSTAGGLRSHRMKINSTTYPEETETLEAPGRLNQAFNICFFTFVLNAGDGVSATVWQNSAGSQPNTTHRLTMALVRPL